MSLGTLFTSLIPIASVSSMLAEVLAAIGLFIDGIVYQLLSYAFKLFYLMCQLNFDSLYAIISPLVDRLKALVMVFIVFKLGIELITYLLNPDSAPKESPKLLKNILITAALLISYTFIFGVMNELSMLIIGVPDGYEFKRLNELADVTGGEDEGLIARFIFGGEEMNAEIGDFIAYQTLSIFVVDSDGSLKESIADGDQYNFKNIKNLASKVDKTVEYHGIISTLIGIYLIICIVKSAIEIGIRMFKLLLLQVMAPIAIVSIIKDGTKGKTFSGYCKLYFETFIQAFIRIASMLIITVFISQFFINIGDFFGSNLSEADGWITKGLLMALICVAGFKFASDAPKFIDQILGTKLADDKKGGFANFLSGAIGGTIGAATGLISGASAGVGGAVAGLFAGGYNGGKNAIKGEGIAAKVKSIGETRKANADRAEMINRRGGAWNIMAGTAENMAGVGRRQDFELAEYDRQIAALDEYDSATAAALKNGSYKVSDTNFSDIDTTGFDDGVKAVKFGDDKDKFKAEAIQYHSGYATAVAKLESAKKSGDEATIAQAQINLAAAKKAAEDSASTIYDTAKARVAGLDSSGNVIDEHSHNAKLAYNKSQSGRSLEADINVKNEKAGISSKKNAIKDRSSYSRTHDSAKNK